MNFAVMRATNSYPQLEVHHDVEWKCLNYDVMYDAIPVVVLSIRIHID